MAHVIIGYSVSIYNKAELLSGALGNTVLGYQNFKVDIHTNVPFSQLGGLLVAPVGYYFTGPPSITPTPPKVGLYEVTITSTNFSKQPQNAVIERQSGSTPGVV